MPPDDYTATFPDPVHEREAVKSWRWKLIFSTLLRSLVAGNESNCPFPDALYYCNDPDFFWAVLAAVSPCSAHLQRSFFSLYSFLENVTDDGNTKGMLWWTVPERRVQKWPCTLLSIAMIILIVITGTILRKFLAQQHGLYALCSNPRHGSHCLESPAEMLWGGQMRAKECCEGLTFWDCKLSWLGW